MRTVMIINNLKIYLLSNDNINTKKNMYHVKLVNKETGEENIINLDINETTKTIVFQSKDICTHFIANTITAFPEINENNEIIIEDHKQFDYDNEIMMIDINPMEYNEFLSYLLYNLNNNPEAVERILSDKEKYNMTAALLQEINNKNSSNIASIIFDLLYK